MLNAEGVREIVSLGNNYKLEEIDGLQYHVNQSGIRSVSYPTPQTMCVFSLSQVVSAVKAMLKEGDHFLINVVNPQIVTVLDAKRTPDLKQKIYIQAESSLIFKPFHDDRRHSQEEFVIGLMTKFEKTPERDELISLISKVTSGSQIQTQDDGVTQQTEVKAGVALVTNKTVKPVWTLKPYLTFPEVEQPELPYMLRVHSRGQATEFALYDADGGGWKVKTTADIRDYLAEKLVEQQQQVKIL